LYHIELNKEAIEQFLSTVKKENISVQSLEYTPYQRLIVSAILLDCVGEQFGEVLRGIIHDRESGGFTLGLEGVTEDTDEDVIFATAITHLIGLPNHDAMSGKYYVRFTVKHTDTHYSFSQQACRPFHHHPARQ